MAVCSFLSADSIYTNVSGVLRVESHEVVLTLGEGLHVFIPVFQIFLD